jgi:hypothetical protein
VKEAGYQARTSVELDYLKWSAQEILGKKPTESGEGGRIIGQKALSDYAFKG